MEKRKSDEQTKRLNVDLSEEDIATLHAEIKWKRRIPMKAWMSEAIREKLGREKIRPDALQDLSEADYHMVVRFSNFVRAAPDSLKRVLAAELDQMELLQRELFPDQPKQ